MSKTWTLFIIAVVVLVALGTFFCKKYSGKCGNVDIHSENVILSDDHQDKE